MENKYTGEYTKAFLSDKKIKVKSLENEFFHKVIDIEENEAVYIYSFKKNKLLFTKGFSILNKKDENLSMIEMNSFFTPYFQNFIHEYSDKLLFHLYNNFNGNESFSSKCIVKVEGVESPILLKTKVFKTDDNGNLISIIGRVILDDKLKTSDIVQYSLNAKFEPDFLEEINQNLIFEKCISQENIKLIEHLEKSNDIQEISKLTNISIERLNLNIQRLLKRFNLKNKEELIPFAKDNFLIPNQFERFNDI